MLTRIAQGNKLPIDPTRAEAWSYDDSIDTAQEFGDILLRDLLTVDGDQAELTTTIGSRLEQGFINRLIGILELYVLPDQGNGHLVLSLFAQSEELLPVLELGLLCWCHARLLEHNLI